MEFRELLKRRRMHRAYTGEPVDRAALERIAKTIRRAPSGGFSQGASVVVVTDPAQRQAIVDERGESVGAEYHGTDPWMGHAAAFLVICTSERHYHERYQSPDKLKITGGKEIEWPVPYWFVDAGAYMMLVLLAAIDEGLAAAVFGFERQKERLARVLGLPDDVVPIGVVAIGVPTDEPNRERTTKAFRERRRPDEDVIHWERWGGAAGNGA